MTIFANSVSALGVLAALVWIALLVQMARHRRLVRRLADQPDGPPGGGWPTLAAIFAARDEAATVERATRALAGQDYPGLEVIAVDDRSTDGTGAILDRLADEGVPVRVEHVTDLPDGWLGKTNALRRAAGATAADWLLFTDADVIFAPGALRRAVAFAAAEAADHVVILPAVPTESAGERIFLAVFQASFALYAPIWQVEDRNRRAALGVGAGNLVRAEAFRAIGGFGRLALSVDDDMQLGRALKWAGFRPRVVMGEVLVSVRWQVGLGGHVRGLEKNFFSVSGFRLPRAIVQALALVGLMAGAHAGVFVGPWWARAICAAGVAAVCACIGLLGRAAGIGWAYGLTLPVGGLVCAYALLRSAWLTLRRGGVRWREHLYPLAALRAHRARREAWMRELWKSTR